MPFVLLKELAPALRAKLEGRVVMFIQKIQDGFIERGKAIKDLVAQGCKNARVNNGNRFLHQGLIPGFIASGGKYTGSVMIGKIQKIFIDYGFIFVSLGNSAL